VLARNREQDIDPTAVEYDAVQKSRTGQLSDRLGQFSQRLGDKAETRRQEHEEREVDELAKELARRGITRPDLVAAARVASGFFGPPVELPMLAEVLVCSALKSSVLGWGVLLGVKIGGGRLC